MSDACGAIQGAACVEDGVRIEDRPERRECSERDPTNRSARDPVLVIGAKPAEGPATLARLGIPFLVVGDPVDGAGGESDGVDFSVHFRTDPLAVLSLVDGRRLSAVLSFTELGLLPAALLSEMIGVPGPRVGAVLRTRNKLAMRIALGDRVTQPEFGLVGQDAPRHLPVIVKPVSGSGSRGLGYVDKWSTYNALGDLGEDYIWETYVRGREFSVEAVSEQGRHRIIGVTEKFTTGEPHFVEVEHRVPARLTARERAQLEQTTRVALDVLDVGNGPTHTELKWTGDSAVLIETHTRAGGDRIPYLHELVTGYDQDTLGVLAQLGLTDVDELVRPAPRYACAGVRYFRWTSGVFGGVTGLEDARALSGVVDIRIAARPGDELAEWQYSHDRPGHCIAGGSTPDEVIARLDEVERRLHVRPQSARQSAAHVRPAGRS